MKLFYYVSLSIICLHFCIIKQILNIYFKHNSYFIQCQKVGLGNIIAPFRYRAVALSYFLGKPTARFVFFSQNNLYAIEFFVFCHNTKF